MPDKLHGLAAGVDPPDRALTHCCRTILDVPEVCKDLWAFFQSHIKARAASGAVKIALLNSSAL